MARLDPFRVDMYQSLFDYLGRCALAFRLLSNLSNFLVRNVSQHPAWAL